MAAVWGTIKKTASGAQEDAIDAGKTKKVVSDYNDVFDEKDLKKRAEHAQDVTRSFYDLVTDFYEYGWGQSFHFAPRYVGESFDSSIARHEHSLSSELDLRPGDQVLDAGCGVMGPARAIARFSGATITGLNLNAYQIKRCQKLNKETMIPDRLKVKKGDFMNMPFPDNTFDKGYAIEAFCHAPDRVAVYKQMYNKLKPGGAFGAYEWVLTDKYESDNKEHQKIKYMIEKGNSICELGTTADVERDLEAAGFETKSCTDLAATAEQNGNDFPWYSTLEGSCSLSQLQHTRTGRSLTHIMVTILETIRVAPTGTTKAHEILTLAADGLVLGGRLGIFTPMFMVIATKPL